MRFSQIFLKMGYNTGVNVYKIVKKDILGCLIDMTEFRKMYGQRVYTR